MNETAKHTPNANTERPELPPIFNKKQLYFFLFPNAQRYQSQPLRKYLFCDNTLFSLGIRPNEYGRIKTFTAQQCAAIRRIVGDAATIIDAWKS
jgi:hypothetical protein